MPYARYDDFAEFLAAWDATDDPVSQALLGLLGPLAGTRVLDMACGHGRTTRALARRGADVVGVDISGNLIGMARESERADPAGIRYIHADVTAAGLFDPAAFDAVACNFGLSDIDDLDGAIAAASHALPPGGRFVFSILHPCFAGGKDVEASWPAAGRYYDEGHWTAQGMRSGLRRRVGASHRKLSTYLNTLRAHDLWLDRVAEPLPEPDWDPAHDADRKPLYFVARTLKLTAAD
jgi:SAM-dependent methyltransferase